MADSLGHGEYTSEAGFGEERRTAWVSEGLEALMLRLSEEAAARSHGEPHFDVVIVGSGYGGAVAADRLSTLRRADGEPLRICMLERGREYLPGAFPARLADLAGHVRFTLPGGAGAKGRLEGLFDLRVGADISVLLANGLGGGSLINAGVMEFPRDEVFDDAAWPAGLRTNRQALRERAQLLRRELGAADANQQPNAVERGTFGDMLPRQDALRRLGQAAFRLVPLSMALKPGHLTAGGVQLDTCNACGDCFTGCNHAAKDSLDVNLLRRAQRQGVSAYSGATVSRLARSAEGWSLEVWHTDAALRRRMAGPLRLSARRVILAAGTLGSTEILMRSQTGQLRFSSQLGQRFSGNGDALAAVFDANTTLNGAACEHQPPDQRHTGPTITGMVDLREQHGFVLQDLGVPGPLRRLFEEATATSALLHRLGEPDDTPHHPHDPQADPCAVDPRKTERSMAVALIGRDDAGGVMAALPDDPEFPADAGLRIDWPSARDDPRLDACHAWLAEQVHPRSDFGGRMLPNPLWRLLPADMEQMLGARKGPLLTVHPLGGCPMGDGRQQGVVSPRGEVFDAGAEADHQAVHDGLFVLDGAIVPTSLGINPALTIATLADQALAALIDGWVARGEFVRPAVQPASADAPQRRPVFRVMPAPARGEDTKVQVLERLCGEVELGGAPHWVELSLAYEPKVLHPPGPTQQSPNEAPRMTGHVLPVLEHTTLSRLRVFKEPGSKYTERPDSEALLIAPLSGTLRFFHRERSTPAQRRRRAWWAWLLNRGMRDTFQAAGELVGGGHGSLSPLKRLGQSLRLATRAGEVRLFEYELTLQAPVKAELAPALLGAFKAGAAICGVKRLSYERRSSPWTQLMRLHLTRFPGLRLDGAAARGTGARLHVDPVYFARNAVPLLRLTHQENQPAALADLATFLLYVTRILVSLHLWSFRKPDAPSPRVPQRLPGAVPGLPPPQIHEVAAGDARGGMVRLTRYPRPGTTRRPVLMIHGYSASGTSFAHEAVNPNLAGYLWQRGVEPWIVDLRTSCGMPTATQDWAFEDIALADIPTAVRFVREATGADKIDVVSHCMGSAMFAMALLADRGPRDWYIEQSVHSWVMSQIGPAMYFSPANILRAYLIRYVRYLLPGLQYQLRAGDAVPGVDGDMFDRFIAALPYLDDARGSEFDIENPIWPWKRTPWVGTRHRLDALIGRTFDARRMAPATLERIDDFFGSISLATMSQPIHFARRGFVTDRQGRYWGTAKDTLLQQRLGGLRMLSLHAQDNGLADPETREAIAEAFGRDGARLQWQARVLPDCGHQDVLIGAHGDKVFRPIDEFLREGDDRADDR